MNFGRGNRARGCHFLDYLQSGSRYKERIYSVAMVSEFSESAVSAFHRCTVKVEYEGIHFSSLAQFCSSILICGDM